MVYPEPAAVTESTQAPHRPSLATVGVTFTEHVVAAALAVEASTGVVVFAPENSSSKSLPKLATLTEKLAVMLAWLVFGGIAQKFAVRFPVVPNVPLVQLVAPVQAIVLNVQLVAERLMTFVVLAHPQLTLKKTTSVEAVVAVKVKTKLVPVVHWAAMLPEWLPFPHSP